MSRATAHTGGLWWWLKTLLSGRPHIEIGRAGDVYLRRWFIVPRNRFLNIYLHQFLRDDDDRALHDHPWDSISLLVRGQYREVLDEYMGKETARRYQAPAMIFRKAEHRHRLALVDGAPAWTVFITGPKRRHWGFWCPKGFVHWRDFTSGPNGEHVGRGCE